MQLPIQQNCDMDDPEEHLLWALVSLPGVGESAPLALPEYVARKWSKHLYEAGFRHDPELQEIKYVPPAANTNWVTSTSGKWVDKEQPLSPMDTAPDLSELTLGEKRALMLVLKEELGVDVPMPDENVATVEDSHPTGVEDDD